MTIAVPASFLLLVLTQSPAPSAPPSAPPAPGAACTPAAYRQFDFTPNGYAGKSLNFHEGRTGKWRQVWIDNGGTPLFLEGGRQGASMVLQDAPESGPINRVTWTPMDSGKVRQHWEKSKDTGRAWETVFDGLYTPRAGRTP